MGSERRVRDLAPVRHPGAVVAALAVAIALSGCGQSTATRTATITSSGGSAGFQPDSFTTDKGDTMVVMVRNATTTEHGFSIAGQGVSEVVPPGETLEVRFTATRAGTFRIFCQLHEDHRTATLTVR